MAIFKPKIKETTKDRLQKAINLGREEALKEVKYKGALSFKINGEKFDKLKKSTQIERLKNLYDIGEEFKKTIKGI